MIGESTSQSYNYLIQKTSFFKWIDDLRTEFKVYGPVREKEQTIFQEISSSKELFMEYPSTMLSPGKLFIYKPREEILKFKMEATLSIEEIVPEIDKQVIVGIHPCDVHAILYLDKVFLGAFTDPHYKARRAETILIALNCVQVLENCFCSSIGTGPHLAAQSGYDMVLTDFGDEYLAEFKSRRIFELLTIKGKEAGPSEWRYKSEREQSLLKSFRKVINVTVLDELFMKNLDHPVWDMTADERCLSCSNCVMVCPTCFCYDVVDEVDMDLKGGKRFRQLDACQDLRFAEVNFGNFRRTRSSRLRQFVLHKLNYTSQLGLLGTVGCGRCITWCPTKIDLTEMAKEIQRSPIR